MALHMPSASWTIDSECIWARRIIIIVKYDFNENMKFNIVIELLVETVSNCLGKLFQSTVQTQYVSPVCLGNHMISSAIWNK